MVYTCYEAHEVRCDDCRHTKIGELDPWSGRTPEEEKIAFAKKLTKLGWGIILEKEIYHCPRCLKSIKYDLVCRHCDTYGQIATPADKCIKCGGAIK